MNLHQFYLPHIKEKIAASFVGYENYKDKYALKVIKNKKTEYFPLEGTPNDVTQESYQRLIKNLTEHYAG